MDRANDRSFEIQAQEILTNKGLANIFELIFLGILSPILPVPDQVNLSFVKIKLENLISINLTSDYLANPLSLAVPCPPL